MPAPLLGLTVIIALYIFCLIVSILSSLIYLFRTDRLSSESKDAEQELIRIERTPTRRRRRRKANNTITVCGRIIDDGSENLK